MEPMALGSPGSPGTSPVTRTLPNILFGDLPAPPTTTSPVPTRQPEVISPIASYPRHVEHGMMASPYMRASQYPTSPLVRDHHRPGAPPVVGLEEMASPYTRARRQLDYSRQPADESSRFDSFQLARPNESRMNGDDSHVRLNGAPYGRNDHMAASPPLRRSEVAYNAFASPGLPVSSPATGFRPDSAMGDESSSWITVFGFPPGKVNSVISSFLAFGQVVDTRFGDRGSNWVHLRYSSPASAERALSKNGCIVQGLMVGVKRCDEKTLAQSAVSNASISEKGSSVTPRCFPNGVRDATAPIIGMNGDGAPRSLNTSSLFTERPVPQREKGFVRWALDLVSWH